LSAVFKYREMYTHTEKYYRCIEHNCWQATGLNSLVRFMVNLTKCYCKPEKEL
jgi:hypothetical protein